MFRFPTGAGGLILALIKHILGCSAHGTLVAESAARQPLVCPRDARIGRTAQCTINWTPRAISSAKAKSRRRPNYSQHLEVSLLPILDKTKQAERETILIEFIRFGENNAACWTGWCLCTRLRYLADNFTKTFKLPWSSRHILRGLSKIISTIPRISPLNASNKQTI